MSQHEEETEQVLAMLADSDDDDDDDEDLWTRSPVLDRPRNNILLSSSSSSRSGTECTTDAMKENTRSHPQVDAVAEVEIKTREYSEEELQEQAVPLAEQGLSDKKHWRYMDVQTLDQVRWHRSGKQQQVYPCYVVHDHATALSGIATNDIKLTKRNDTLIRFISLYANANSRLQAVPATQLLAFDGGADSTTTTLDDKNGSSSSSDTTIATPPHWDAACLQKYLDLIKHQKCFADPEKGAVRLRAEKIFVEQFLMFVWEKQQQHQQDVLLRQAQQQGVGEKDSLDDDNDNDDDSECNSKAGGSFPAISDNSSMARATNLSNPVTQDSADEETCPVESAPAHASLVEQEKPAALSKKASRLVKRTDKLRAGDLIQYCPVHSRFGPDTMKQARVVQIDPKNTHFPIVTSEDDHLPRDHKIKVVARFMRNNQLVAVQDPMFSSDLGLARGTFDGVATKSEKVADYYRKTQTELADAYERKDPSSAAEAETTTVKSVQAEETVSRSSLRQGLQLSTTASSLPPKKRKATTMLEKSSACSKTAPKVAKQDKTPSQPQQFGSWRNDLEELLEKNRQAANYRRANWSTLAIQKRALETALAVCANHPNKSAQTVAQLLPALGTAEQRLQFLTGNQQNLLSARVLDELTQGWKAWLQEQQRQPSEASNLQNEELGTTAGRLPPATSLQNSES